jgi:hypothetical protein
LGDVHTVPHLATITSFTGSYESKNGVTSHTLLVKSNNCQLALHQCSKCQHEYPSCSYQLSLLLF